MMAAFPHRVFISQEQRAQVREECYAELNLPKDPQAWLVSSLEKLKTQIDNTNAIVATNQQVFVEDGRVHLTTIDASELPERVVKLKVRIHESWPQIRIQDLLVEVDSWVNFTGYFRSLRGRRASIANFLKGALAALIAKGCNIGIQKMAALTLGLGTVTLHRINELYLYEGTLRGIIDHFVGTANSLPVSQFLGDENSPCRMGCDYERG